MKERKIKFPDQYKFLAVTKGLHVKGSALLKPIKIHLPLVHLEHFEEADTEYVFFLHRWRSCYATYALPV